MSETTEIDFPHAAELAALASDAPRYTVVRNLIAVQRGERRFVSDWLESRLNPPVGIVRRSLRRLSRFIADLAS